MISYIFSFFLSLFLTMLAVLLVARIGLFSEFGFTHLFDEEYYEYVLDYANGKVVYYTYPTGIAPSAADGVITLEDVKRDVKGSVKAAFDGSEYAPDLSDFENRLRTNVTSFFLENGLEVTSETEEIISTYISEIEDIYLKAVKLPGVDSIAKVRSQYLGYVTMALVFVAVMALVLMVSIHGLHHFPHRAYRYIAYATGGASLMCLVVPLGIFLSGVYRGLKLKPQHFYHFGVSTVERALLLTILFGIVFAVVTFILVVVVARMRDDVIHRHSHHHHH